MARSARSLAIQRWLTRSRFVPAGALLAVAAMGAHNLLVTLPQSHRRAVVVWEQNLGAWADVRQLSIENWLERLASEGDLVAAFPTVRALVRGGGDPATAAHVAEILNAIAPALPDVSIEVWNGRHIVTRGHEPLGDSVAAVVATARETGRRVIRMTRDAAGRPLVVAAVPIRPAGSPRGGAVVIGVDPALWLYPFLRASPGPATGEATLVRFAQDRVTYLSPVRGGHPLELQLPHPSPRLAARVAIAIGDTVGRFVDYRGAEVFAATRLIRGTSWALVVKVDAAEVLGPIRTRFTGESVFLLLMVAVLGALILTLWWGLRRAAEADRGRADVQLAQLLDHAYDALVVINSEGRIHAVNQSAERLYGGTRGELVGLSIERLRPPGDPANATERVRRAFAGEAQVYETENLSRAGEPLALEVSLRRVELADDVYLVAVLRDIRERKVVEARIAHLGRLRQVQSAINALIVRESEPELLLKRCCDILVESGGFIFAWVALPGPRGSVSTRASAGVPAEFHDAVRAAGAGARCPAARALADGRTASVAYGDEPPDDAIERAAWSLGCRAGLAAPIRSRHAVVGALAVCAARADAFDAETVILIEEIAADLGFALAAAGRAEAQRRAEQLLRAVVDGTTDVVFVKDRTGRYVLANRALEDLLGRPRSLIGATDIELFAPEEAAGIHARDRDIMERGVTETFEESLADRSGGRRTYLTTKGPWRAADGAVLGVFGIARDVTEAHSAERDRKRLAAALEQSGEAAIITDATGTIIHVNPAFERITGYTRLEVLGRNPRILQSGRQSADTYRTMWQTLLRAEVWTGEFVNRRRDGSLYHAEVTVSPVRDERGQVTSFVGLQRDVTRARALDAQLRQAQKMEAVGQLTGGIAHDFNNVLQVVLANASLLATALAGGEAELRTSANEIAVAASRGSSMIRKLLAFSRKEKIEPVPTDVAVLVRDFARVLRRVLPETITITVPPAPAGVAAVDPGVFEQVLLNVGTNARDAMPKGGSLELTVETMELDEAAALGAGLAAAGTFVVVGITDSGAGMDAATLERVFEPFFTTKEAGQGTGLGLPMVLGLMQMHGGHAGIASVPGRGTTVRLYLPASRDAVSDPAVARPADSAAWRGTEPVLVVEDEPAVRAVAMRTLRRLGYTVICAADGVEALELLRARPETALVLTDRVMPRCGGLELLAAAREQGFGVPFVVVSGYIPEGAQEIPDDVAAVLSKPWTADELARVVRRTLDARAPGVRVNA